MKKSIAIVLLLGILFSFSACGVSSVEMQLLVAGNYGVTFLECRELKGHESSTATVIEKDEYGRILFKYTAYLITDSSQKATAIMICQKAEYDYVYYYEDVCFYMGELDDEKTIELKERNDWGLPLEQEKMTVRDVDITFDLYLHTGIHDYFEWNKIDAALEDAAIGYVGGHAIDKNETNTHALVYCYAIDANGDSLDYFAIVDREYNVSFMEFDTEKEWDTEVVEELIQFKQDCGF